MTNDLRRRLNEHKGNIHSDSFTSKYKCYYLIYGERHQMIECAIEREKEIKGWTRVKKEQLINKFNSEWKFFE